MPRRAGSRWVALALTDLFSMALGLPEGRFRAFVDRSTTTLRTIDHERRSGDADSREHRMAKLMGPRTLRPGEAVDTAAGRPGR